VAGSSRSTEKNTDLNLQAEASSKKELKLVHIQMLMKAQGLNPSLPCAVFDTSGTLIGANKRMKALFSKDLKLPMEQKDFEKYWPFHNEDDAGPALLRKALHHKHEKNIPWVVIAEGKLKNFRLQAHLCIPKNPLAKKPSVSKVKSEAVRTPSAVPSVPERMIVAEIVRSGDLLGDRASRQALFRTMSHEIRTTVMAMNGYLGILSVQSQEVKVVEECTERLKILVRRLESVVNRLSDFKAELETDV
jgi:hypothetical protein